MEAEVALRRVVSLNSELGDAFALLGAAVAKQGRPEEAVHYFQRALELGFDAPSLRLGYSGALDSLGREEQAEKQLEAYRALTRP